MNYIYELEMKVRDYECDLQGIVNNANYQHYLEHTRHEFLTSVGISFAALHEQGVDPVVARINMAFKTPLKSLAEGVGTTLQTIAILIGLGFMFGAILQVSGGVEVIADTLLKVFGEKKLRGHLESLV